MNVGPHEVLGILLEHIVDLVHRRDGTLMSYVMGASPDESVLEHESLEVLSDFTVDIEWKAGKVIKTTIRSGRGAKAVVRSNGTERPLDLKPGESRTLDG